MPIGRRTAVLVPREVTAVGRSQHLKPVVIHLGIEPVVKVQRRIGGVHQAKGSIGHPARCVMGIQVELGIKAARPCTVRPGIGVPSVLRRTRVIGTPVAGMLARFVSQLPIGVPAIIVERFPYHGGPTVRRPVKFRVDSAQRDLFFIHHRSSFPNCRLGIELHHDRLVYLLGFPGGWPVFARRPGRRRGRTVGYRLLRRRCPLCL